MHTISREFWISAAHRIEGHPKCGRLHGHNYKVTIKLRGALDLKGMVLDFGLVDQEVKPIIDAMDHMYLVSDQNIRAQDPIAEICRREGWAYMLNIECSTAEMMAQKIAIMVAERLEWLYEDVIVEVQETPRNVAVYGE
jgi:6-pyruvoyl tetrahydropterin synthase/QueD family protein